MSDDDQFDSESGTLKVYLFVDDNEFQNIDDNLGQTPRNVTPSDSEDSKELGGDNDEEDKLNLKFFKVSNCSIVFVNISEGFRN